MASVKERHSQKYTFTECLTGDTRQSNDRQQYTAVDSSLPRARHSTKPSSSSVILCRVFRHCQTSSVPRILVHGGGTWQRMFCRVPKKLYSVERRAAGKEPDYVDYHFIGKRITKKFLEIDFISTEVRFYKLDWTGYIKQLSSCSVCFACVYGETAAFCTVRAAYRSKEHVILHLHGGLDLKNWQS